MCISTMIDFSLTVFFGYLQIVKLAHKLFHLFLHAEYFFHFHFQTVTTIWLMFFQFPSVEHFHLNEMFHEFFNIHGCMLYTYKNGDVNENRWMRMKIIFLFIPCIYTDLIIIQIVVKYVYPCMNIIYDSMGIIVI